jgi:predicted transcriptional regulator
MGLHRLEIEVSDELLSRIDRVSEEKHASRQTVVVTTLDDHLARDIDAEDATITTKLEFLEEISQRAAKYSSNLSERDVLKHIRDFRGDE